MLLLATAKGFFQVIAQPVSGKRNTGMCGFGVNGTEILLVAYPISAAAPNSRYDVAEC